MPRTRTDATRRGSAPGRIGLPGVAFLAGALACIGGCGPSAGPPDQGALGDPNRFTVAFAQDGRFVPIRVGAVELRRQPFTVVITMPLLGGVMVNAAPSASLYNAVDAGRPAGSVLPVPAKGISENLFNPRQALYVNETDYNYWYYLGPAVHRFSEVREADGQYVCRRDVANFAPDPSSGLQPISAYPGDELFLVFVGVELDGHQRVEKSAEGVVIRFR